MKQFLNTPLLCCLALLLTFGACVSSKNYNITVIPKGMHTGDTLYMGAYKGLAVYPYSKATLNEQGNAQFIGKNKLKSGMYAIGAGTRNNSIDFLISDNQPQNFTVIYDTANIRKTLTFNGSEENTAFTNYYYNVIDKLLGEDGEIKKASNYKQFQMLSLYIKTNESINFNADDESTIEKYFDNIDFADGRIARMPLLENMLYTYFFHVVNPLDTATIMLRVDDIIYKAAANTEVYELCASFLYDIFMYSPIPGHEKVAEYVAKYYIITGFTSVFEPEFIEKVKNEINWINKNPIGSVAPDVKLQSIASDYIRLSDVSAKATILFFLDPDCGMCKEIAPVIYKLYQKYQNKGLNVYAVYVGRNEPLWKSYILKQKFDWVNVWTNDETEQIYNNYELIGMPTLYLLDNQKRIVAKDTTVDDLKLLLKEILK